MSNNLKISNCDIIILHCTNVSDEELLNQVRKLAHRDVNLFKEGYVFELDMACSPWNDKEQEYVFVAIQRDKKGNLLEICGFARVVKGARTPNIIELESIATKGHTKDPFYKGVGTMLVNKIVETYSNEQNFLGLHVHSETSSIGFYLKVGFKRLNHSQSRDLFIPFQSYYKTIYLSKDNELYVNHLNIAKQLNDKEIINKLNMEF
jgi:ribosomal protein S18 acetylase RimI-like enzyme